MRERGRGTKAEANSSNREASKKCATVSVTGYRKNTLTLEQRHDSSKVERGRVRERFNLSGDYEGSDRILNIRFYSLSREEFRKIYRQIENGEDMELLPAAGSRTARPLG